MLWLADNGENNFWLAQRPQENALNSAPTVETLQTVLGDGLPAAVQKLIKGLLRPGWSNLSDRRHSHLHLRLVRRPGGGTPGALLALAIKVVGTAVDAPSAGDRLREEQVDVLLHGSSRGDRLPTQDIHTLQAASPAPIVIVTSGCTPEFLQEALAHGVQDVAILPQLTESLVFTLRGAHVLNHNAARPQAPSPSAQGAPAPKAASSRSSRPRAGSASRRSRSASPASTAGRSSAARC